MPGFKIPIASECHEPDVAPAVTYNGPPHTLETARTHRYRILINGYKDMSLYAYKCTRPTPEIDVMVVHNAQHQMPRPGKNHWGPVEFTFYDVLSTGSNSYSKVSDDVYGWWSRVMLKGHTGLHNPLKDYLATTFISMTDGVDHEVWAYTLYESWPSKVSPSPITYTSSDISDVTVTLQFTRAVESKTSSP